MLALSVVFRLCSITIEECRSEQLIIELKVCIVESTFSLCLLPFPSADLVVQMFNIVINNKGCCEQES